MTDSADPKAEPKPLKDGSGWYIKVAWKDGRLEFIDKFGSETTACDWIQHEFPAFCREKL
jgi:hypothetical protein